MPSERKRTLLDTTALLSAMLSERKNFDVLPDEILLRIFEKLSNAWALYSLFGHTARLNAVVCDSTLLSHLSAMRENPTQSVQHLPIRVLHRLCTEVLPHIGHRLEGLDLERWSMRRVLHAADFPNVRALGLYNVPLHAAATIFTRK